MFGELRALLPLALPIMAASSLTFAMQLVDFAFVGHLGTHELAACGLGNNLFSMVQHPIFGTLSALDTLLAQANGAKNMAAFRRSAQVGAAVGMLCCVPWIVTLLFAGRLLALVGVEPSLAKAAGEYCAALTFGVPPFVAFQVLTKILQAQNIVAPSVWVALIANVLNLLANWVFIHRLGLGLRGAPLATSASRWAQLVVLCAYVHSRRRQLRSSLPAWRIEWRGWAARSVAFLRLGLPGALMLGLEAWFFEASTFTASFLSTTSFDAHCIMLSICAFTFLSGPFALGIAASIRVGQHLGGGDGARARATAHAVVCVVFVLMLFIAAAKISLRDYLGLLFTADRDVVATVSGLTAIAALFQISDGIQAAFGGVMRGMGKQAHVAALNFLGFWLIGFTVGPALTFAARLDVAGLWWGMAVGLTAAAAIGGVLLLRTDWDAEVAAARARVGDGDGGGSGGGGAAATGAVGVGAAAQETSSTTKVGSTRPPPSEAVQAVASTVSVMELPVLSSQETSRHADEAGEDGWHTLNPAAQQAAQEAV